MEPRYKHGVPWASTDCKPRRAAAHAAASSGQLPGPSWTLPKKDFSIYISSMMAAAEVYQAHCSTDEEDADVDAVMLRGDELVQLTRSVWQSLGADDDAAETMCAAMEAAALEQHDTLQLSWSEFQRHIRTAYTEVLRQQALSRHLEDGLGKLRAAGTCITLQELQSVMAELNQCIRADPAGDSVEGVHARLQLAKLLVAYTSNSTDFCRAEQLLAQVRSMHHRLQIDSQCSLRRHAAAATNEGAVLHQSGSTVDSVDSEDDTSSSDTGDGTAGEDLAVMAEYANTASTLLGLILSQSRRDVEAAELMSAEGYSYRLSPCVLAYERPQTHTHSLADTHSTEQTAADAARFVSAIDNALPAEFLQALQKAFSPASPFWREHDYAPDGSTPYFSYVHKLPALTQLYRSTARPGTGSANEVCLMDQVIDAIRAHLVRHFPEAAAACWAEWWAHCRPHSHGHQLHFDSDNEGQWAVRNPYATSVLYLSEQGVGGPTLVTAQAFNDKHLVPSGGRGWLVHPQPNRLAMLRGDVLHGVIPGHGVTMQQPPLCINSGIDGSSGGSADRHVPRFRVTLMVALWRDIQSRTYPADQPPGAAMPYPYPQLGDTDPQSMLHPNKKRRKGPLAAQRTWPALFSPVDMPTVPLPVEACTVQPVPVSPVWSDVATAARREDVHSLEQLALEGRLPPYDACFQGF